MANTLVIKGAKELDRALAALPTKVQGKCLSQATRDAGKILLAAAKSNTPVATGTLQKSEKVRAAKGLPKGARGVVVGVGKNWFQGETYYGAFVEFGHKRGKRNKSKAGRLNDKRPNVPGEHMIEYAFEEVGGEVVVAVVDGIRARIDDAIIAARAEGGS